MRKPQRLRLIGMGLALFALSGCTSKDAEHLARIGQKTAGRASGLTSNIGNGRSMTGWQMVRSGVEEMTLDARVTARLRWDKDLHDSPIVVRASGSVVELSGAVPSLTLRRRAVELAERTLGVERVVDALDSP
jgi:osmotically-inducible protein OsmY